MAQNQKLTARKAKENGLWYIEDEHGALAYEAEFMRQDAELIAQVHNETGLESFEEILAEIEKRGLSLAPTTGERVTWIWKPRGGYGSEIPCRAEVLGITGERVRIRVWRIIDGQEVPEEKLVRPENLRRRKG